MTSTVLPTTWYNVYVSSTNIRRGKGSQPGIGEALLEFSHCTSNVSNPALTATVHTTNIGSDAASFQLIRTHDVYDNMPIYQLLNRRYGIAQYMSNHPLLSGNHLLYVTSMPSNTTVELVGLVFNGVTNQNPFLHPNRSYEPNLILRHNGQLFRVSMNVPHKNDAQLHHCDYIVGWQQGGSDINDVPSFRFQPIDPTVGVSAFGDPPSSSAVALSANPAAIYAAATAKQIATTSWIGVAVLLILIVVVVVGLVIWVYRQPKLQPTDEHEDYTAITSSPSRRSRRME